jgi:hypothetical protein
MPGYHGCHPAIQLTIKSIVSNHTNIVALHQLACSGCDYKGLGYYQLIIITSSRKNDSCILSTILVMENLKH